MRDADRKTFADIERDIGELAKKARNNKLSLNELQGGSFTITNGGTFGSLLSTPILNSPQVGILGMHKIQLRPVAIDEERFENRPMMYIALSYDHRIVDGKEAVGFLVTIKICLKILNSFCWKVNHKSFGRKYGQSFYLSLRGRRMIVILLFICFWPSMSQAMNLKDYARR